MKWKPSQTATVSARAKLPKLAQKYFHAGRKAVDKDESPKQLHRFRIETKRFRYALELFRPIYGVGLDRHIQSLRGIQDALGKVNDYATIRELLDGDKQLKAQVEKAQNKKIKDFRQEWKKFDSDGQLERWKAFLARARRAPTKRIARQPAPPQN